MEVLLHSAEEVVFLVPSIHDFTLEELSSDDLLECSLPVLEVVAFDKLDLLHLLNLVASGHLLYTLDLYQFEMLCMRPLVLKHNKKILGSLVIDKISKSNKLVWICFPL